MIDFNKWTNDQLRRTYLWHYGDRPDTMENEIRRCWILQEINIVLQKRNVSVPVW